MTCLQGLPNAKEFLEQLSHCSADLGSVVDAVNSATHQYHLYREFLVLPTRLDVSGRRKFCISTPRNPDVNLLDKCQTLEEVRLILAADQIAAGQFVPVRDPIVTISSSGERIYGPGYMGPTISLHKDANIQIDLETDLRLRSFFNGLGSHPAFEVDMVTLARLESQQGGLRARFGDSIPQDLANGQRSLEKRCVSLTEDQRREATVLFDIASKYFKEETDTMFSFSDTNRRLSPEEVARRFFSRQEKMYPGYQRRTMKLIEAHRTGNNHNGLTDQVISAVCFGMNLVNTGNKTIIVSNDYDIQNIFDVFYGEILPRYMAQTTLAALKQVNRINPRFLLPGYTGKLVAAAREQIDWARKDSGDDQLTLGVLYSPKTGRIYTQGVAGAFREYFNNVSNYRHQKSELIGEMARTGHSPDRVIAGFMGKTQ